MPDSVICKICKKKCASTRGLSRHLSNQHSISPEQYTLNHIYGGIPLLCFCGCGKATKYFHKKYCFNKYVHNHHKPTLGTEMSFCTKAKISKKQKDFHQSLTKEERLKRTLKMRQALIKLNLKKHGVENVFLLQRHTWSGILEQCNKKGYVPLFEYREYKNNKSILPFLCEKHDSTFEARVEYVLRDVDKRQCRLCKTSSSFAEQEVSNFVKSIYPSAIHENTRSIIPPKELDVYIPDKNIAIEFNGLYWHSIKRKSNKKYHYEKFLACKEKNVRLFQVYEDEWRDKKEIWKSIINVNLGNVVHKLDARKLTIEEDPSVKEVRKFIDENHLQGYCRSSKKIALKDESDKIVLCITFRKPFTKKHGNSIEIARLCSAKNIVVRGGFSRVMKYALVWAKKEKYIKILTYSDCRYSWGNAYKNNGFDLIGHTGVGYDYTDFHQREGRFKYRAQKPKTEKEVAEEADVHKIYNAGNYAWELIL